LDRPSRFSVQIVGRQRSPLTLLGAPSDGFPRDAIDATFSIERGDEVAAGS